MGALSCPPWLVEPSDVGDPLTMFQIHLHDKHLGPEFVCWGGGAGKRWCRGTSWASSNTAQDKRAALVPPAKFFRLEVMQRPRGR